MRCHFSGTNNDFKHKLKKKGKSHMGGVDSNNQVVGLIDFK